MWLTKHINYKRSKIFNKTVFGRYEKLGFELTKPLTYSLDGQLLYLPKGYVWDGPSYPSFLNFILGDNKSDTLLAASAFHDSLRNVVDLKDEFKSVNFRKKFGIYESAKIYKKMILSWRPKEIKKWQAQIQFIGLLTFNWIYSLVFSGDGWKKV